MGRKRGPSEQRSGLVLSSVVRLCCAANQVTERGMRATPSPWGGGRKRAVTHLDSGGFRIAVVALHSGAVYVTMMRQAALDRRDEVTNWRVCGAVC